MTNRAIESPYLPEAPVYDNPIDKKGNFTDPWNNWHNSITRTLGYVVVHDRFFNAAVSPVIDEPTAVLKLISMEQSKRDLLQNAFNGTVLYNTTTNKVNFRENGAWVTFLSMPA